jgi:hypothetical protein
MFTKIKQKIRDIIYSQNNLEPINYHYDMSNRANRTHLILTVIMCDTK